MMLDDSKRIPSLSQFSLDGSTTKNVSDDLVAYREQLRRNRVHVATNHGNCVRNLRSVMDRRHLPRPLLEGRSAHGRASLILQVARVCVRSVWRIRAVIRHADQVRPAVLKVLWPSMHREAYFEAVKMVRV